MMSFRKKNKKSKFPSELRLDSVSGNWVIIATNRAKRPETFEQEDSSQEKLSKEGCPFCEIETQENPTLVSSKGKEVLCRSWQELPKNWTIVSIPNKYPAFMPLDKLEKRNQGKLYKKMNAVGFHEVIVTRSHEKQMAQFSVNQIKEVLDVYQSRYIDLMSEKFVNHISIFHNHGRKAGASIAHPHSQIITTPLIDVDLQGALSNSRDYYRKEKQCIYCAMNKFEKRNKERIVFENKDFLVICPFASKTAFQVIISPKKHLPYFERITEQEKCSLAEAFQKALKKLFKGLNNPAYNFYLHTAPCDKGDYDYYHWHWTILPKTSFLAGFEIGTQMEISTIEPEKAATYLKKQ